MRVALFSKIPPLPATGGNRARILQLCEALMARGCEIDFHLIPSRQMTDMDEPGCRALFHAGSFNVMKLSPIAYAVLYTKILSWKIASRISKIRRSRCDDIDYIAPHGLGQASAKILRDKPVDIVIVEYVHYSSILDAADPDVLRVIDTHDSFHNEFTDSAEGFGLSRADVVLAIQEKEAARFRKITNGKAEVLTLSHSLREVHPISRTTECAALFIGSSFEANFHSAMYFIDEVMPSILKERADFKFHVVGSICSRLKESEAVILHGVVEDIEHAFSLAPVSVNPITRGTGVKIKLLESLAYGFPVVSTELGVDGVEQAFLGGVDVVPNADPAAFSLAVIRLMEDGDHWRSQSAAAQASAQSWRSLQNRAFDDLLDLARSKRSVSGS